VVGEDTDHGGLPWLVSAPASDNLKCTHLHPVQKDEQFYCMMPCLFATAAVFTVYNILK
jgi:hypothetical protein